MNENSLSSGELARRAGVSPDTLRHYERQGLLPPPPRQANGYRRYPESALPRVQLIRRALHVGFTITELKGVLRLRDQGGAPCARVRQLAAEKLADVEEQLTDLLSLRDDLRAALRHWDRRLAQTASGKPAHLLETLALPDRNRSRRATPFSTNSKRNRKDTNK